MKVILLVVVLSVAACGRKATPVTVPTPPRVEIVEVDRPVPYRVPVPPELLEALKKLILPTFISPSDPLATSALDAEGERIWRQVLEVLRGLDAGLKAYAAKE